MFESVRAHFAKTSSDRIVLIVWAGLLLGFVGRVVFFGGYVVDSSGAPVPEDFLSMWSAGRLAWIGHAAQAYDPAALHRLQMTEVGHPFGEHYYWFYPPLLFVPAMVLALMPYAVAYVLWSLAMMGLYWATIRRLFPTRKAAFIFGLSPAAFVSLVLAQNGLLTASLFGGALLCLERRPLIAGGLLALLAYKPQFGVLIPLALIAGGSWRAFLVATGGVAAWCAVVQLVNASLLGAFLHGLLIARADFLVFGLGNWRKLQSIYAISRIVGLSDGEASSLAIGTAVLCAVIVAAAWRSRLSFEIKAAILTISSLTATPYLYIYDLPLLTVAIGFLLREAIFDDIETGLVVAAYVLIVIAAVFTVPIGIVSVGLVGFMVLRRIGRGSGLWPEIVEDDRATPGSFGASPTALLP